MATTCDCTRKTEGAKHTAAAAFGTATAVIGAWPLRDDGGGGGGGGGGAAADASAGAEAELFIFLFLLSGAAEDQEHKKLN